MDTIDLNAVIQTSNELYPESITKKPMVNAKHLFKRLCSTFTYNNLFETSCEELLSFCGGIPARIEFIHSIFEVYDNGDSKFRDEAKSMVKRIHVSMKMSKDLAEEGHKIHLTTHINKLVYDIILLNPTDLFSTFEEIMMDETRGNKEYGRKSLNKYFSQHPGLKLFNELFDQKYDIDKWYVRWSKTHSFRKELYDQIVDWVTKRTQTSSSKPEISSQASIARYITTLKLLSNYINGHLNPPKGVDCLQWFFSTTNIEQLNKALIHIIENDVSVRNDLVKSTESAHTGTEFIYAFVSLARTILVKYFSNKQDVGALNVNYILSSSLNKRESSSTLERRHFLPSEIMMVEEYITATQNSMWQLAFVILKEVGLRVYALTSLKVSHFLNSKDMINNSINVLEKQRRWRTFVVSDTIKKVFQQYLEEFPEAKNDHNRYIFRSQTTNHTLRYTPETMAHNIKQFCNNAGVVGNFVHIHAFRHTLVNSLMHCGNKIENVSKYMGHSSVTTTEKYYWTDNVTNIISTMNVPWLKKKFAMPIGLEESDDDDEIERESQIEAESSGGKCAQCDVLFHLLMTYHGELTDTQKLNIKTKVPNIENIFDTLCSESLPSHTSDR
jgi:integrase/recombinase XerD